MLILTTQNHQSSSLQNEISYETQLIENCSVYQNLQKMPHWGKMLVETKYIQTGGIVCKVGGFDCD